MAAWLRLSLMVLGRGERERGEECIVSLKRKGLYCNK